MTQTRTRGGSRLNRVLVPALALAAIGGWSMFAYASLSLAEAEKQLHGQIASSRTYQAQYLSERKQAEASAAELTRVRGELESTRGEFTRLSETHHQLQTELADVRERLRTIQSSSLAQSAQAQAALIHIKPRPTRRDVAAAQEALTELGYGPLEADGIVGPSTRQAIEAYQRATGLVVTGELYAETLQALVGAGGRVAAQ